MKKQLNIFFTICSFLLLIALSACSKKPQLELSLSDKYEGNTVEIINYLDSTILASSIVKEGKTSFILDNEKPLLAAVLINGKTRGFYIVEPGTATLTDSVSSASGTPLNDRFSSLMVSLDSVEQYDDMELYLNFINKSYTENANNPISDYLAIEIIRFGKPEEVERFVSTAPQRIIDSQKVKHYVKMAQIRASTAPGKPYQDFSGEDVDGNPITLSSLVEPGKYTLLDFWASWCPYCIKELPDIKDLKEKWEDKGFNIVGVAVRDLPEDTKAMVEKKSIDWPVIYNTKTVPYDIYGFAGIPHHILIGPDGTIISREENIAQLDERLNSIFK